MNKRPAVLPGAALALLAAPAAAETSDDWQHTMAVYLMAAGMDGEVGVGTVSADADLEFSDILDHLKMGTMAAYAAERGPLAFGLDVIYMNLEADAELVGVGLHVEVDQATVSVDLAYELTESIEVLGGARFNDIDTDIAVTSPTGDVQTAGRSESWVDPYVGGRLTLPFASNWDFVARADVGGFDVGSELAWQLVARVNWHASEHFVVTFGYRILDVDYDDGEGDDRFLFDVQSAGPLLGAAWRF
jgi:hypothetical protein